jgi:uncharacterized protein (TIGR02145 family)
MKTLFTLCVVFLILPFCYGQDHNDFKTLKNYTLILRADTLIGTYIGEVDRLNVDGKKQKTPLGFGYFIGETIKKEKYVVCRGNWFSGALNGINQISFFSNDYYPNLLKDSLENPKRMNSRKEIWSSFYMDSLINESYSGNFLINVFESGTGIIKDPKYYYQGQILKWLPHGKGHVTFKNDSIKLAGEYFNCISFEGDFLNGQLSTGTMNFSNSTLLDLIQSMAGNWEEKSFTGNGKVHFSNGTNYDGDWKAGSFEGKGKYSRIDGWEFNGDFIDNQLNKIGHILTPDFQYSGNVANWNPNGTGIITFLNDTIYLSNTPFVNPKFEGEFIHGEMGNGTMFFDRNVNSNNVVKQSLAGNWKNKSYSGNGKVTFNDSTFYNGEWLNGKEHGKGKLNVEGKYSYEGDWVNGLIQGNGKKIINDTMSIASASILVKEYEGFFTNGKFEKGIIRSESNGELKGVLKDGEFSGEGKITFQKSLSISLAKNSYEAISYSGKIIDSKLANGQMKLKSGETLTGDWTNNLFSGSAKLNIGDAYSYDGDWFQGEIHGPGKMTKKNEWLYTGSFNKNQIVGSGELMYFIGNTYFSNFQGKLKEDQFDIRLENNEKLRIVDLNDLVLEGSIIDNTFIGFGEVELDNKAVYKGSISMSFDAERIDEKLYSDELEFTTIGRLSYPNGDTLHVTWKKDGYLGTGRLNLGLSENGDSLYEEGTFRNGLLDGQGKKVFMFGLRNDQGDEDTYFSTYLGEFKNGSMHGKGKLNCVIPGIEHTFEGDWSTNNILKGTVTSLYGNAYEQTYTGGFSNFKPTGNGKQVNNKETYIGTFVDGLPNGIGKIIYEDGSTYEGEVSMGIPSGKGVKTLKNKQTLSGNFENGEYQKPKIYKQAKIGNQVWMTENLSVTQFRNGDLIPEANSIQEWINAGYYGKPAWCYVEGDVSMSEKFGFLYNWYAVNDPRGLAPEGWHIPSDYEWNEIAEYLGGEEIAGEKMKSKEGWERGFNGSNSCGFNGLPGGELHGDGNIYLFTRTGPEGNWWSSTEYDNKNAIYRYLWWGYENTYVGKTYPDDGLHRSNGSKNFGFSVRCIRD